MRSLKKPNPVRGLDPDVILLGKLHDTQGNVEVVARNGQAVRLREEKNNVTPESQFRHRVQEVLRDEAGPDPVGLQQRVEEPHA